MAKRWYEYWLRKAAAEEKFQNLLGIGGAIFCLHKARKYTADEDELLHLEVWRSRLMEQVLKGKSDA